MKSNFKNHDIFFLSKTSRFPLEIIIFENHEIGVVTT